MRWLQRATGRLSPSIVPSAVLSTQPGAWRALPPPFVQKGITRRPRASVQQQRPCVNRHRHSSHQPSAKHSNRSLQKQEQPLTSQLLSGNGTQEQRSRRAKRLTMLWRTEKREASSSPTVVNDWREHCGACNGKVERELDARVARMTRPDDRQKRETV